ncbi:MAG: hypothetical protein UY22_C0001G0003 [Candidatus Amesbacteria bacterium GW2011_GWC1_48_10]|uniref:Uncharacterized protein n=1 Tax=Candidatus Amesbacteria bacterium GW2011_GWC1_48_10 TaxID=1618365 RepID=A0A0G1ULP1_9BACT|nr:MAG: hypothetical protein UY22_C0001G0003 [Candidatus Amesbacteria bacterium GW2011_GWC1_48_10]
MNSGNSESRIGVLPSDECPCPYFFKLPPLLQALNIQARTAAKSGQGNPYVNKTFCGECVLYERTQQSIASKDLALTSPTG